MQSLHAQVFARMLLQALPLLEAAQASEFLVANLVPNSMGERIVPKWFRAPLLMIASSRKS